MRIARLLATLILAVPVMIFAQKPEPVKPVPLPVDCRTVSTVASSYLERHGVRAVGVSGVQGLTISGATGLKPWTDAAGNRVNDLKVYWTFSDKQSGDELPFLVWRMRLGHYWPEGEIKLSTIEGGCSVAFQLSFGASGANVLGILPVDSQWSIGSNGRMEREYLDGISAELAHH